MKTNRVDETDVSVTTLGFGGAAVGNLSRACTDEEAQGALDAAWNGGIRYFDTAPHYGLGLSERRLGAALAHHQRHEFTISTKVGRLLLANPHPTGSDLEAGGFDVPDDYVRILDYSSDGVKRSIEQSLQRLNTDYIDIVYVHDPDDHVEQVLDETLPALARLRDEGVVRAIGAGMNHWQPLVEFVTRSDIDVVMLAGRWTLLDRTGEPLLRACALRGVAVVAAAPFNSGLLSTSQPSSGATFDYRTVPPELLARAKRLAELCAKHDVELPHVAINFPLRNESVVSVVAGFGTEEHARSGVAWMGTDIPEALWEELLDFDEAAAP